MSCEVSYNRLVPAVPANTRKNTQNQGSTSTITHSRFLSGSLPQEIAGFISSVTGQVGGYFLPAPAPKTLEEQPSLKKVIAEHPLLFQFPPDIRALIAERIGPHLDELNLDFIAQAIDKARKTKRPFESDWEVVERLLSPKGRIRDCKRARKHNTDHQTYHLLPPGAFSDSLWQILQKLGSGILGSVIGFGNLATLVPGALEIYLEYEQGDCTLKEALLRLVKDCEHLTEDTTQEDTELVGEIKHYCTFLNRLVELLNSGQEPVSIEVLQKIFSIIAELEKSTILASALTPEVWRSVAQQLRACEEALRHLTVLNDLRKDPTPAGFLSAISGMNLGHQLPEEFGWIPRIFDTIGSIIDAKQNGGDWMSMLKIIATNSDFLSPNIATHVTPAIEHLNDVSTILKEFKAFSQGATRWEQTRWLTKKAATNQFLSGLLPEKGLELAKIFTETPFPKNSKNSLVSQAQWVIKLLPILQKICPDILPASLNKEMSDKWAGLKKTFNDASTCVTELTKYPGRQADLERQLTFVCGLLSNPAFGEILKIFFNQAWVEKFTTPFVVFEKTPALPKPDEPFSRKNIPWFIALPENPHVRKMMGAYTSSADSQMNGLIRYLERASAFGTLASEVSSAETPMQMGVKLATGLYEIIQKEITENPEWLIKFLENNPTNPALYVPMMILRWYKNSPDMSQMSWRESFQCFAQMAWKEVKNVVRVDYLTWFVPAQRTLRMLFNALRTRQGNKLEDILLGIHRELKKTGGAPCLRSLVDLLILIPPCKDGFHHVQQIPERISKKMSTFEKADQFLAAVKQSNRVGGRDFEARVLELLMDLASSMMAPLRKSISEAVQGGVDHLYEKPLTPELHPLGAMAASIGDDQRQVPTRTPLANFDPRKVHAIEMPPEERLQAEVVSVVSGGASFAMSLVAAALGYRWYQLSRQGDKKNKKDEYEMVRRDTNGTNEDQTEATETDTLKKGGKSRRKAETGRYKLLTMLAIVGAGVFGGTSVVARKMVQEQRQIEEDLRVDRSIVDDIQKAGAWEEVVSLVKEGASDEALYESLNHTGLWGQLYRDVLGMEVKTDAVTKAQKATRKKREVSDTSQISNDELTLSANDETVIRRVRAVVTTMSAQEQDGMLADLRGLRGALQKIRGNLDEDPNAVIDMSQTFALHAQSFIRDRINKDNQRRRINRELKNLLPLLQSSKISTESTRWSIDFEDLQVNGHYVYAFNPYNAEYELIIDGYKRITSQNEIFNDLDSQLIEKLDELYVLTKDSPDVRFEMTEEEGVDQDASQISVDQAISILEIPVNAAYTNTHVRINNLTYEVEKKILSNEQAGDFIAGFSMDLDSIANTLNRIRDSSQETVPSFVPELCGPLGRQLFKEQGLLNQLSQPDQAFHSAFKDVCARKHVNFGRLSVVTETSSNRRFLAARQLNGFRARTYLFDIASPPDSLKGDTTFMSIMTSLSEINPNVANLNFDDETGLVIGAMKFYGIDPPRKTEGGENRWDIEAIPATIALIEKKKLWRQLGIGPDCASEQRAVRASHHQLVRHFEEKTNWQMVQSVKNVLSKALLYSSPERSLLWALKDFSSQNLLKKLGWYGGNDGEQASSSATNALLIDAMALLVKKDLATNDISHVRCQGKTLAEIRTILEAVLESKGYRKDAAKLGVWLYAMAEAPELLVSGAEHLRYGTDPRWVELKAAMTLQGAPENCLGKSYTDLVRSMRELSNNTDVDDQIKQNIPLAYCAPILTWAETTGILPKQPPSGYSVDQMNAAFQAHDEQTNRLKAAGETLLRTYPGKDGPSPYPKRKEIARKKLEEFGLNPDMILANKSTYRLVVEQGKVAYKIDKASLLDIYLDKFDTRMDWAEFCPGPASEDLGLTSRASPFTGKQLSDPTPIFKQKWKDFTSGTTQAFETITTNSLSTLPLDDQKFIQEGEVTVLSVTAAGVSGAETSANVGRGGFILQVNHENTTRYYEVLLNGVTRRRFDFERSPPPIGITGWSGGAAGPPIPLGNNIAVDYEAYRTGKHPKDETFVSRNIILEFVELINTPAANTDARFSEIGKVFTDKIYFGGDFKEIKQIAYGTTIFDEPDPFIDVLKTWVIPFWGCIEDIVSGRVGWGIAGCAFDILTFGIPVAGKLSRLWGQGGLKALLTQLPKTVLLNMNPIAGFDELAIYGGHRLLKGVRIGANAAETAWTQVLRKLDDLPSNLFPKAETKLVFVDRDIELVIQPQGSKKYYKVGPDGKPFGPPLVPSVRNGQFISNAPETLWEFADEIKRDSKLKARLKAITGLRAMELGVIAAEKKTQLFLTYAPDAFETTPDWKEIFQWLENATESTTHRGSFTLDDVTYVFAPKGALNIPADLKTVPLSDLETVQAALVESTTAQSTTTRSTFSGSMVDQAEPLICRDIRGLTCDIKRLEKVGSGEDELFFFEERIGPILKGVERFEEGATTADDVTAVQTELTAFLSRVMDPVDNQLRSLEAYIIKNEASKWWWQKSNDPGRVKEMINQATKIRTDINQAVLLLSSRKSQLLLTAG